METEFHIQIGEAERVIQEFELTGARAESVVNNVLHSEGGKRIISRIMLLLPSSDRTWAKKKAAAKSTNPFREEQANLAVAVRSRTGYGYLYFPDDGSNTVRHAGEQQFMRMGAEEAAPDIIEMCTANILKEIGG